MKLFDSSFTLSLCVESNADEAILLAARDLQRDLKCLSGQENGFAFEQKKENAICIQTVPSSETEAYSVNVEKDCVVITGSDVLGTVFGIYAFSGKCLGIPATHRFTDLFPEKAESLEIPEQSFSSPSRPVRFRGWFVNDEDLLSEVEDSGFERNLDYNYYRHVMAPEVMDAVIETALRMEYNLIIPATLLDIDKPAEEKLVECAYRRGMFISQHHIEPMGVGGFTADNYLKKFNKENETVSFISNRPLMEEMWRYYAKKWAKYADRVVWQLGLRGKKDEAVWKNDPNAPLTMEGRGAIISDAIGTQHKILCETLGSDRFYSTTTLWNEGSLLYGKGCLKLPPDTVPILADFGIDQMFGEDMFTTAHEKGRNYGVYYHTSFWALGPHLCEGCRPEKMAYSYRIAAEKDCLYYSMLNVSNVRPMHLSISMNAEILKNPAGIDIAKTVDDFDRAIFGSAAELVTPLRYEYYDSFADFGDDLASRFAENWFFFYHRYPTLPFIRNAATDGQLTWVGKYALNGKLHCGIDYASKERLPALTDSREKLEALRSKMESVIPRLPEETRLYFRQFLYYQTCHLLNLTNWCIACLDLVDTALPMAERKAAGEKACAALEKTLEERKVLENGKWKNWHKGDEKMNIPLRLLETRNYLSALCK